MNRAERRKQAKVDKKRGKQTTGSAVVDIRENDGRKICVQYPKDSRYELLSFDLALCLTHTLEHFGDITGVGGQAKVILTVKNGLPFIKVDRECFYQGIYNGFSGKMTAKTCEFALAITLSCHWGNAISKFRPEMAQLFFQHYHKLRETAFQSLSDVEQAELWKFLD